VAVEGPHGEAEDEVQYVDEGYNYEKLLETEVGGGNILDVVFCILRLSIGCWDV
jgi:hypothetical protein